MDFKMPPVQKSAWNDLKMAVNEYAEITGSEIAVVTSYIRQDTEDAPFNNDGVSSLALHGHGDILRRLRGCIELIKKKSNSQKSLDNGVGTRSNRGMTSTIPINKRQPIQAEETHYNQAVARSLCSSFQSLKLDPSNFGQFSLLAKESKSGSSDSVRRGSSKRGRKKERVGTTNGEKGDGLEFDENLLFEEADSGTTDNDSDDDEELADSDDDIISSRPPTFGHRNPHQTSMMQRSPVDLQNDPNQFATSLPVNISMNFAHKLDGPTRFIDNQGPHPTAYQRTQQHQQPHAPTTTYANRSRPIQHGFQDTPNPETMMASMQALARSVTDDSSRIFGERPRPRLNTGESRRVQASPH